MVRYWLIDGKTMRDVIKGVSEDIVNAGLAAVWLLVSPNGDCWCESCRGEGLFEVAHIRIRGPVEIDIKISGYKGVYLGKFLSKVFKCIDEVLHGTIGWTVDNAQCDRTFTIRNFYE